MLIGELAAAAEVSAQTIRFYEQASLMPSARRAANGYRVYDAQALARLRFIRAAQAANLTLSEIRGVVDVRDRGNAPCAHVSGLIDAKLADVRQRIEELRALEVELGDLAERSRRMDQADCTSADICHILSPATY